jgi:hypothetical protein
MKPYPTTPSENQTGNLTRQLIEDSSERTSYLLKFSLKTCTLDCLVEFRKNNSHLAFIHIILPVKIPLPKREEMAVFTTLLNNNLSLGCWELDMQDGSLRFRISYYYEEKSEKFDEILQMYLHKSLGYVEICLPGMMSVSFGNASAKAVYREICGGVDVSLN